MNATAASRSEASAFLTPADDSDYERTRVADK
jgi:hypothetical protein